MNKLMMRRQALMRMRKIIIIVGFTKITGTQKHLGKIGREKRK